MSEENKNQKAVDKSHQDLMRSMMVKEMLRKIENHVSSDTLTEEAKENFMKTVKQFSDDNPALKKLLKKKLKSED